MIPFMAEDMYQNLVRSVDKNAEESVHLCSFPEVNENHIDLELEKNMDEVLNIVGLGRAARNGANIKTVSLSQRCMSTQTLSLRAIIRISSRTS